MRLYITNNTPEDISFDVIVMSVNEFNDIHNHPFIACNRFDEIVVELDDNIKIGYLRPLLGITKVIPKVPKEITQHTISLLCEIYKDRAAELRYTYIKDRVGIQMLIAKMCEQYKWRQFY